MSTLVEGTFLITHAILMCFVDFETLIIIYWLSNPVGKITEKEVCIGVYFWQHGTVFSMAN